MSKRTLTYGALALVLLLLPACEGGAEEDADKQGAADRGAAEQAEAASGFQGMPGQDDRFAIHTRDGKVKLALTASLVSTQFAPDEARRFVERFWARKQAR